MRPANGLAGFPQKRNAIVAPPLRSSGGGLGSAKEIADTVVETGGNVVKKAADVLDDMSWDALLKGIVFTVAVGGAAYFIVPAGFANLTKGVTGTIGVLGDAAGGTFRRIVQLPGNAFRMFRGAEA